MSTTDTSDPKTYYYFAIKGTAVSIQKYYERKEQLTFNEGMNFIFNAYFHNMYLFLFILSLSCEAGTNKSNFSHCYCLAECYMSRALYIGI